MNLPLYPNQYSKSVERDEGLHEMLRKSLPGPVPVPCPPPMHGNTICFNTRIYLNPNLLKCCTIDPCQYIRLEITAINQVCLCDIANTVLVDPSAGPSQLGDFTTDCILESITLCIYGVYTNVPIQQSICLGKYAYRIQIWPPNGTTILPYKPAIYAIVSLCSKDTCYRTWTITLVTSS